LVGIYIEFLLKTVGDQIEDLVPKKCQWNWQDGSKIR